MLVLLGSVVRVVVTSPVKLLGYETELGAGQEEEPPESESVQDRPHARGDTANCRLLLGFWRHRGVSKVVSEARRSKTNERGSG